jgi:site-specific DNA-adenine methylase
VILSAQLRPFFGYYGGKWRTALRYPMPAHERIVEPFAGSAGYATRYSAADVHLNDASAVIVGVWDYLIRTPAAEIRRLPLVFDHVDELEVPQEARDFIGFWLNRGTSSPRRSPSAWMRSGVRPGSFWSEQVRDRTAAQVEWIRHWTVSHGDYADLETSTPATWFVDPPYDDPCGSHYTEAVNDFAHLAEWCYSLPGQLIVCEKQGADWLPFERLHEVKAMHGATRSGVTAEAVYVRPSK